MREIVQDACRIERDIQARSGMVVIHDPEDLLRWENAYFTLTTEDDAIATSPSNTPAETTDGSRRKKPGSVIDLTASDGEPPVTQKVRARAKIVVKQEPVDDEAVVKVADKGKRPVGDSVTGGGNIKVAAKSYHHGNGNALAKTTKAETILANIADGLSPQAQEKREMSRANLLRETINQERREWVAEDTGGRPPLTWGFHCDYIVIF